MREGGPIPKLLLYTEKEKTLVQVGERISGPAEAKEAAATAAKQSYLGHSAAVLVRARERKSSPSHIRAQRPAGPATGRKRQLGRTGQQWPSFGLTLPDPSPTCTTWTQPVTFPGKSLGKEQGGRSASVSVRAGKKATCSKSFTARRRQQAQAEGRQHGRSPPKCGRPTDRPIKHCV